MKKMFEVPGFVENKPGRILELCEYLTPVMNEIHGRDYSYRFWTTLLKDYAKTCVDRENIMSQEVIESKPLLQPFSSWHLPSAKDRWKMWLLYYGNVFLKNSSIKTVNKKIGQSDDICVGLRAEYFEEYGIGVHCPNHYPLCMGYFGRQKRMKTYGIAEQETSIFKKNLIRQLPRFYVEYFDRLINKIELNDPSDKTFHAEHISSDFMKLLIALYVEHGAEYYRYQYGGFVGETERSVTEDKYIDIDRHRTYGWKIHEKDEPFKAFRLEQFSSRYKQNENGPKYDVVIIYNQIRRESKEKRYKELSEHFFQRTDRDKISSILLRPRGFSRKIDNSGELSFLERPSFVTVDKGQKPMADIVKSTRVVVHLNHPSTNFLECVYVDHPVVAILTNENPTEIIKPFYQFFLDEKVMHSDIDSLITHLNSVDLEAWWENVINKPMYRDFKEQFAKKV